MLSNIGFICFVRQNIDMQTIAITNMRLLGFLGCLVVVDVIVLFAWSVAAPFTTSATSPFECIPAVKGFVFVMYSCICWMFKNIA